MYLIRLAIGRLIIWTIQNHGATKRLLGRLPPDHLIRELVECEFCLGFWVYLILRPIDDPVPMGNRITQAIADSLVNHLIGIGWRERFSGTIEYHID